MTAIDYSDIEFRAEILRIIRASPSRSAKVITASIKEAYPDMPSYVLVEHINALLPS